MFGSPMTLPCVLILEHQSVLLNALVRGLQRLGVRDILEATEGEEALALIKAHGGVDIVFCDMSTKGMSGLEFLRRAAAAGLIRAAALCRELPPEQGRAVKLMAHRSGLNLLGNVAPPLQQWCLQNLLTQYRYYQGRLENDVRVSFPIEEDIRRGLVLGEFQTYFQPTVNLISGAVTSVEALVRWRHPSKGLLLAEDFLNDVKALSLVDELFGQVIDQSMSLLNILRLKQLDVPMEINLLACQLESSKTVDQIERTLQRHGVLPEHVTLELSEYECQQASGLGLERLHQLKRMGCRLSIDDFGGSIMTLDTLSHVGFDQLKLRKNLVVSLKDPHNAKMAGAVFSLARPLGLTVCAEGVSLQSQQNELVEMGCMHAQGTGYAAPLSGYMLIAWLERRSRREAAFEF